MWSLFVGEALYWVGSKAESEETTMSCDALAAGGCAAGVCDDCCSDVMHFVSNACSVCDTCVQRLCEHYDCADPAGACSQQCVSHCWSEFGSAPCLQDCVSCRGLWLAVAVAIAFVGGSAWTS